MNYAEQIEELAVKMMAEDQRLYFEADDGLAAYTCDVIGRVYLESRDGTSYLHAKLDDRTTKVMYRIMAAVDMNHFTMATAARLGRGMYAESKFVNFPGRDN